jgi:Fe-S-cluster-containing hydrogenase component 2
MEAISIEDKISTVNLDRCIGCGLCVSTCSSKAITMVKKPKVTVSAKDHNSMYKKIMMERLGAIDKLKLMGKMMTGSKI